MFGVKMYDLLFGAPEPQLVTAGAIKTNDHFGVAKCRSHLTMLSSISQNQTKGKIFHVLLISLYGA